MTTAEGYKGWAQEGIEIIVDFSLNSSFCLLYFALIMLKFYHITLILINPYDASMLENLGVFVVKNADQPPPILRLFQWREKPLPHPKD